jgi:hypothetical protein
MGKKKELPPDVYKLTGEGRDGEKHTVIVYGSAKKGKLAQYGGPEVSSVVRFDDVVTKVPGGPKEPMFYKLKNFAVIALQVLSFGLLLRREKQKQRDEADKIHVYLGGGPDDKT